MVEVFKKGAYLLDGQIVWAEEAQNQPAPAQAREQPTPLTQYIRSP